MLFGDQAQNGRRIMLDNFIKIANKLDQLGFHKEADKLMKKAFALKNDTGENIPSMLITDF